MKPESLAVLCAAAAILCSAAAAQPFKSISKTTATPTGNVTVTALFEDAPPVGFRLFKLAVQTPTSSREITFELAHPFWNLELRSPVNTVNQPGSTMLGPGCNSGYVLVFHSATRYVGRWTGITGPGLSGPFDLEIEVEAGSSLPAPRDLVTPADAIGMRFSIVTSTDNVGASLRCLRAPRLEFIPPGARQTGFVWPHTEGYVCRDFFALGSGQSSTRFPGETVISAPFGAWIPGETRKRLEMVHPSPAMSMGFVGWYDPNPNQGFRNFEVGFRDARPAGQEYDDVVAKTVAIEIDRLAPEDEARLELEVGHFPESYAADIGLDGYPNGISWSYTTNLSLFEGGWYRAAKRYKEWVDAVAFPWNVEKRLNDRKSLDFNDLLVFGRLDADGATRAEQEAMWDGLDSFDIDDLILWCGPSRLTTERFGVWTYNWWKKRTAQDPGSGAIGGSGYYPDPGVPPIDPDRGAYDPLALRLGEVQATPSGSGLRMLPYLIPDAPTHTYAGGVSASDYYSIDLRTSQPASPFNGTSVDSYMKATETVVPTGGVNPVVSCPTSIPTGYLTITPNDPARDAFHTNLHPSTSYMHDYYRHLNESLANEVASPDGPPARIDGMYWDVLGASVTNVQAGGENVVVKPFVTYQRHRYDAASFGNSKQWYADTIANLDYGSQAPSPDQRAMLICEWQNEALVPRVNAFLLHGRQGQGGFDSNMYRAPMFGMVYGEYASRFDAWQTFVDFSKYSFALTQPALRDIRAYFAWTYHYGCIPGVWGLFDPRISIAGELAWLADANNVPSTVSSEYFDFLLLFRDLNEVWTHDCVREFVLFGERLRDPSSDAPVCPLTTQNLPFNRALMTDHLEPRPVVEVSAWRDNGGGAGGGDRWGIGLISWSEPDDFTGAGGPGQPTITLDLDDLRIPRAVHNLFLVAHLGNGAYGKIAAGTLDLSGVPATTSTFAWTVPFGIGDLQGHFYAVE